MKNSYTYLNSKTFEIENIENIIPVDKQLAQSISNLNKKGYYTEMYNKAKITKPFLVASLIHGLNEEGLLNLNDKTKDLIKKIIKESDYESTIIVFKENYHFDNLPNGFKMVDKDLYYDLSILKDNDEVEFKTLLELDNEHNESIKNLEEWSMKLPNREN